MLLVDRQMVWLLSSLKIFEETENNHNEEYGLQQSPHGRWFVIYRHRYRALSYDIFVTDEALHYTPRVASLSHGRKRWWGELWKIVSLSKSLSFSLSVPASLFRWLKTHVPSRNLPSIFFRIHESSEENRKEINWKFSVLITLMSHTRDSRGQSDRRTATKATQIPTRTLLRGRLFGVKETNTSLGMFAQTNHLANEHSRDEWICLVGGMELGRKTDWWATTLLTEWAGCVISLPLHIQSTK